MGNNLESWDKNAVFYSICICSLALGTENCVFSCLCFLSFNEQMLWESEIYKQIMKRPGGEILMVCADVVLFLFLDRSRRNE